MSRHRAKALAMAAVPAFACVAIALTVVAGPVAGTIAVVILGVAVAVIVRVEVRKHAELLIDAMMAAGITILSLLFAVAAVSVYEVTLGLSAGLIALIAGVYALWRLNRVIDSHNPPGVH